jgi:hypothetical protein
MDFLSESVPSVLDLIEGIRDCYKSSSNSSSISNSSSSSSSASSSDVSLSTDLGPEFLEVLVRDFATNQDWVALKRMGALSSQENNTDSDNYSNSATKKISTISGRASFISPPPIPSPLSNTNHQSTVTYVDRNDDVNDDESGEEYEDDESDKAEMNSHSNSRNPNSKKVKFPGSTSSLSATFSGARRNGGSDVELSQGALGALERVQLQMKLLSAQADSLSLQADRLEAEMSEESNGIDVHRATVILKKRGDVLKTLRGKSDVLLAKTTIALSR